MKLSLLLILSLFLTGCRAVDEEPTQTPDDEMVVIPQEPVPEGPIEEEPEPEPEPEKRISFYGLGDNLIHYFVFQYANQGNGVYDFTPIYKNLADDIGAADIAYINQETVLGGSIQFDFVLNGEDRAIENIHFEPNVIFYETDSTDGIEPRTNFEVIHLKDFTLEHEQRHALNGYQGNIVAKDYFIGMVEDVISEEFL